MMAGAPGPGTRRGFLFDLNRCTGCHACRLACTIENELAWGRSWRQITTFNERRDPAVETFHLSLACNHCADAPCLASCPALAFARDDRTGTVTLDPEKCIGCRYCSWACPYDAPLYDPGAGVMTKCTFCAPRLAEGRDPACVSLCPTGALTYGELEDDRAANGRLPGIRVDRVDGFPEADLDPAIRFTPLREGARRPESTLPPVMTPFFDGSAPAPAPKVTPASEWPLLVFTLAAAVLVALFTASRGGGPGVPPPVFLIAAATTLAVSSLHLGKKLRAWRAVLGFRRSWVSREILFTGAFAGLAWVSLARDGWPAGVGATAAALGFLALFSMDRVYDVALGRGLSRPHSAEVTFTGLYFTGILLGSPWLAGATGGLKLALFLARRSERAALRVLLGFVLPAALWFAGAHPLSILAAAIAGEALDRLAFYRELTIVTPSLQAALDLNRRSPRPR